MQIRSGKNGKLVFGFSEEQLESQKTPTKQLKKKRESIV